MLCKLKTLDITASNSSVDTSSLCLSLTTSHHFSAHASAQLFKMICSVTSCTILAVSCTSSCFMNSASVFTFVLGHSSVSFYIWHAVVLLYSFLYSTMFFRFFGVFGCLMYCLLSSLHLYFFVLHSTWSLMTLFISLLAVSTLIISVIISSSLTPFMNGSLSYVSFDNCTHSL